MNEQNKIISQNRAKPAGLFFSALISPRFCLARKFISLLLSLMFFINVGIGPSYAREGNYGTSGSWGMFGKGTLAAVISDALIILGVVYASPETVGEGIATGAAMAVSAAASTAVGTYYYYHDYESYGETQWDLGTIKIFGTELEMKFTKGQVASMTAGVITGAVSGAISGAASRVASGAASGAESGAASFLKDIAIGLAESLAEGWSSAAASMYAGKFVEELLVKKYNWDRAVAQIIGGLAGSIAGFYFKMITSKLLSGIEKLYDSMLKENGPIDVTVEDDSVKVKVEFGDGSEDESNSEIRVIKLTPQQIAQGKASADGKGLIVTIGKNKYLISNSELDAHSGAIIAFLNKATATYATSTGMRMSIKEKYEIERSLSSTQKIDGVSCDKNGKPISGQKVTKEITGKQIVDSKRVYDEKGQITGYIVQVGENSYIKIDASQGKGFINDFLSRALKAQKLINTYGDVYRGPDGGALMDKNFPEMLSAVGRGIFSLNSGMGMGKQLASAVVQCLYLVIRGYHSDRGGSNRDHSNSDDSDYKEKRIKNDQLMAESRLISGLLVGALWQPNKRNRDGLTYGQAAAKDAIGAGVNFAIDSAMNAINYKNDYAAANAGLSGILYLGIGLAAGTTVNHLFRRDKEIEKIIQDNSSNFTAVGILKAAVGDAKNIILTAAENGGGVVPFAMSTGGNLQGGPRNYFAADYNMEKWINRVDQAMRGASPVQIEAQAVNNALFLAGKQFMTEAVNAAIVNKTVYASDNLADQRSIILPESTDPDLRGGIWRGGTNVAIVTREKTPDKKGEAVIRNDVITTGVKTPTFDPNAVSANSEKITINRFIAGHFIGKERYDTSQRGTINESLLPGQQVLKEKINEYEELCVVSENGSQEKNKERSKKARAVLTEELIKFDKEELKKLSPEDQGKLLAIIQPLVSSQSQITDEAFFKDAKNVFDILKKSAEKDYDQKDKNPYYTSEEKRGIAKKLLNNFLNIPASEISLSPEGSALLETAKSQGKDLTDLVVLTAMIKGALGKEYQEKAKKIDKKDIEKIMKSKDEKNNLITYASTTGKVSGEESQGAVKDSAITPEFRGLLEEGRQIITSQHEKIQKQIKENRIELTEKLIDVFSDEEALKKLSSEDYGKIFDMVCPLVSSQSQITDEAFFKDAKSVFDILKKSNGKNYENIYGGATDLELWSIMRRCGVADNNYSETDDNALIMRDTILKRLSKSEQSEAVPIYKDYFHQLDLIARDPTQIAATIADSNEVYNAKREYHRKLQEGLALYDIQPRLSSVTYANNRGAIQKTKYFGLKDDETGNVSLVPMDKTTTYIHGPFGTALSVTEDRTRVKPRELTEIKSEVKPQTITEIKQGKPIEITIPAKKAEDPVIDFKRISSDTLFGFDKWAITKEGKAELEKNVEDIKKYLEENPNALLNVEGNTDQWGYDGNKSREVHNYDKNKDGYNIKLSKNRAEAIKEFYVEQGILSDRITTTGAGCANAKDAYHAKHGLDAEARNANFTFLIKEVTAPGIPEMPERTITPLGALAPVTTITIQTIPGQDAVMADLTPYTTDSDITIEQSFYGGPNTDYNAYNGPSSYIVDKATMGHPDKALSWIEGTSKTIIENKIIDTNGAFEDEDAVGALNVLPAKVAIEEKYDVIKGARIPTWAITTETNYDDSVKITAEKNYDYTNDIKQKVDRSRSNTLTSGDIAAHNYWASVEIKPDNGKQYVEDKEGDNGLYTGTVYVDYRNPNNQELTNIHIKDIAGTTKVELEERFSMTQGSMSDNKNRDKQIEALPLTTTQKGIGEAIGTLPKSK